MQKKALITGITGQDGAYLTRHLVEKGYQVFGTFRRNSSLNIWRLKALGMDDKLKLVPIELLELSNVISVISEVEPDEIYNLAAQSFVATSFSQPIFTADVNALGPARILEAIRTVNPKIKFYQASSSEMFGKVRAVPQDEQTPFYPRSPYSVAKLFAHTLTVNYREAYDLFACGGILFNHESPLRGMNFVTRKITAGFARIKNGLQDSIDLGNIDAKRDWGFSGDYVRGMYLMLQQEKANDYVLATGETHTVREFAEVAAQVAGFQLEWNGQGVEEKGIDRKSGKAIIKINPEFFRPSEVDLLLGNPKLANEKLSWQPEVKFSQLATMMMESDLKLVREGQLHF